MKKLYTTILAAICVFSALAASITPRHVKIDANNPEIIKTWDEVSKHFNKTSVKELPSAGLHKMAPNATKANKAAKAYTTPATIEELIGKKYEASYQGLLTNNSGLHDGDATFEYYPGEGTDAGELYINMPDYETPLYVEYSNGSLNIYDKIGYGQNDQYMLVLCRVNSITGAPASGDVTVPFNEETGTFEFPSSFAWAMCAISHEGELLGYIWGGKKFSITISHGDFKINAKLEDECTPDNNFKFTINPGADVAQVKAMVLPYDGDIESHKEYIAQLGSPIEAGTYTIDPVNKNVLVSSEGPMKQSSHASILFASYDKDGNLMKTQNFTLIVVLETEDGWRDVATIAYEDKLFAGYYTNFSHTQEAKLQEKEDTPGLYRIVDPYSEHKNIHKDACHHYMIFDTRDAEWVTITFSVSGVDHGDGILTFGTAAALGYDKNAGIEANLKSGTMTGQTIIFPAKSIYAHEQKYNQPGSWSYFNIEESYSFTLPDIALNIVVVDQEDAPISGVKVKLGNAETEYTTDENGKTTIAVPFETGYFGKVNVNFAKAESALNEKKEISLNGANTTYTYKASTSGINNITVDMQNAPVEYFNLQGMRVDTPAAGQIVIKRQGNKATKIVVK